MWRKDKTCATVLK